VRLLSSTARQQQQLADNLAILQRLERLRRLLQREPTGLPVVMSNAGILMLLSITDSATGQDYLQIDLRLRTRC
jgi:hypothetical protein